MTNEEIKAKVQAFGVWYHSIELFPGYFTPSNMQASLEQWRQIRKVRDSLDYKNKIALDIGTMDGMWAFEAEKLGARAVYAMDIWQRQPLGHKRFDLAKEILESQVQCEEINVHTLHIQSVKLHWPQFDIIQCLGMLYHVQNPLLALNQIAACLVPGGSLLLEAAVFPIDIQGPWMRFNSDRAIYDDFTTFWAPNWECLLEMLKCAGFSVDAKSVSVLKDRIHRVCLVAKLSGPLQPDYGLK